MPLAAEIPDADRGSAVLLTATPRLFIAGAGARRVRVSLCHANEELRSSRGSLGRIVGRAIG